MCICPVLKKLVLHYIYIYIYVIETYWASNLFRFGIITNKNKCLLRYVHQIHSHTRRNTCINLLTRLKLEKHTV